MLPMSRPVISSEEEALQDMGAPLSQPHRLERDLSLPLDHLSWEEFEVFCYLLLRREHPGEEVVYYGKTADLGRDIVHRRRDGIDLVQCKNYSGNVPLGEVRADLAKLFTNLHSGAIPEQPSRIWFYATPDLTSHARDLLSRENWLVIAEKALTDHLGAAPPAALLEFARTWWPAQGIHAEPAVSLSDRAEHHQDLVNKFFRTHKVIDASREDVRTIVSEELDKRLLPGSGYKISGKTWEDFFVLQDKKEAIQTYLHAWPGLTPKERFEAPDEFPVIQGSVHRQPLTIVIGPPAAGKTFLALQILWDAFQRDIQVSWIAAKTYEPTDGPIPRASGYPDMRQRIQHLTAELGIKPFHPPLDHHEFIAANLKPQKLVYIEDPFGTRDEEFAYSLHTYSFFDLDACVNAISQGAAREGCHILISSREGLFDRWQAERVEKGLSPLPANLIRISGQSYTHKKLEELALRLAKARGLEHPEDVAFEIGYLVEYPYEIESILRELPLDANAEQASAEAERYQEGLKPVLRQTLVADNDQELLFLVILASQCTDPKTLYLRLHQALHLSGEPEISLNQAVERYRAFVVRSPARKLMDYGPDADEVFSPSHSVVGEAILEYLQASATSLSPFLNRLACALPEAALDKKSAKRGAAIALPLLSLGIGGEPGEAQDGVLEVLLNREGLSLYQIRDLMRSWGSLGSAFKDRLFAHLEAGLRPLKPTRNIRDLDGHTRTLLIEVASTLTLVELPAEDAWRFTRLLFHAEVIASSDRRGMYTWELPWSYLFERLDEAPDDILQALKRIATAEPDAFVRILGEAAVAHWEKLPEPFKTAFFADTSLRDARAQENALQGIARHWEKMPKELRDLFNAQATSEDPEIRDAAITAAFISRWRGNPDLQKVFLDAARDPEIKIPLGLLHMLDDEEVDRRFARILFERADDLVAAEMLHGLLRSRGEPLPPWKLDLARECLRKGGDRAWSILAVHHFGNREVLTEPLHDWKDSIAREPEPIRLGALWAYGHSKGKSPKLDPEEVISLIQGLKNPFRSLALAYLSAQVQSLPAELQAFLQELEATASEDGEAVRIGKEKRGSDAGNNPWSAGVLRPTA